MQSRKKHIIKKKKEPSRTCCDKNGLKRIFTPFNKFQIQTNMRPSTKPLSDKLIPKSSYYSPGLTIKEKSYIISVCQTNSLRYLALKNRAAQAIKHSKIFTIYEHGNAVRKALYERGWVEKIPATRINLDKIRQGKFSQISNVFQEIERLMLSIMVEKEYAHFIWVMREDHIDPKEIRDHTIVNKLKIDGLWTTKDGLCTTTKNNSWFYIEDVAEVFIPRTYATDNTGEIDEFVSDFKVCACTSLLKWVLSMIANDRPIFLDCGKIAINVIVFALNRCKEFLFSKQNRDIDKKTTYTPTPGQWNAFLKNYYRIIAKQDVFQTDWENKLPVYMGYAKFLLNEIYKHRPQLSSEGCHNIWIIKPCHNCRGRGIRMASKLGVITDILQKTNSKYVIQKYIEEPLLIHDTKFDIRQYYLITSTYPLVIWMYKDCYLKFSSQNYSLGNYHESIHLTNNAVQRKYTNCSDRHADLPENNMWDLETYKQYLIRIGKETVWDNIIYSGMKKSIVAILLACQEQLAVSKNRFELYGCDFILDREFKPWLIEVNSSPDLTPTTSVTAKICPNVLRDIVKGNKGKKDDIVTLTDDVNNFFLSTVIIDRASSIHADTGQFECIYRQPITTPRYGTFNDLQIRGRAVPNDYFYRGKLALQGSEDYRNFNKSNLSAMMIQLKHLYDWDIMVKPDEYDRNVKRKSTSYTDADKTDEKFHGEAATALIKMGDKILKMSPVSNADKRDEVFYGGAATAPIEMGDKILKKSMSPVSNNNKSVEDIIESCLKDVSSYKTLPEDCFFKGYFSKLDDASSGDYSLKSNDGLDIHIEDMKLCSALKFDSKLSVKKDIEYRKKAGASSPKILQSTPLRSTTANVIREEDTEAAAGVYSKKTRETSSPKILQDMKQSTPQPSTANVILEATMKLFDFLDKKKHEYSKSSKLSQS